MKKLSKRKSPKEESFLESIGIVWHNAFGYITEIDEESSCIVTPNEVDNCLQVFYLMKRENVRVQNEVYWSEKQVLNLLKLIKTPQQ